ncbi:MAG: hypothetical protein PWP53_1524 [Lacrimispora sp.]|nr:hypothetical protein [Lacrimispora sp.]
MEEILESKHYHLTKHLFMEINQSMENSVE